MTDIQREHRAQQEFEKALTHLQEAEDISAQGFAPNACVHAAYYAMHHAAAAALFAAGGVGKLKDVPKSHEHVLEHYGKLVAEESQPLASTGLELSRARTDRVVADYNMDRGATLEGAKETTLAARAMLTAIGARWPSIVRDQSRPGESA